MVTAARPRSSRHSSSRQGGQPRASTKTSFRPQVSQWRLDTTMALVLATATGMVAYDSYVSYEGFKKLGLSGEAPLVLAGFVFVTQMGVGVLHALGQDFTDIKGGSSTSFLNDVWP